MKESKYIIRKIIIGVGIALCLMFIKSCNVNASSVEVSLRDITYNNRNLLNLNWYNVGSGNNNISFDYALINAPQNTDVLFNSLVLCSDAKYTSSYPTDPSEVFDIHLNNTNYSCNYSNSNYTGGRVVIITFLTYNDGPNSFVVYQDDNASIQLIDFVVDSSGYVNPLDYSSETLINQNSQIINQNNTIINNGNSTNNKLDDLNKNLTDESSPNLNGLENSAGWLKPGPVDSIINLPLTLLNNLQTNLGNTCNPTTVTLPYVDKDITLPCISSIYKQIEGLDTWFQGVGVIASAVILYKYFMYLYKRVDDILTLRENTMEGYFEDSLWGGM